MARVDQGLGPGTLGALRTILLHYGRRLAAVTATAALWQYAGSPIGPGRVSRRRPAPGRRRRDSEPG
jgi:hypothetical protein